MAINLSRVKEHDALRAQREPFWQRIQPGCFLSYRPSARDGAGTWIARAYDEGQRRYQLKALGDFGTLPGRDRFADANKAAEAFAILVESGGQPVNRRPKRTPIGVQKGPPSSSSVTGMTGALFVLVAA
ncbi:hypothetical protein MOP88_09655 [Sphingomonas sp. WKB10]|nr:hypothetical protein [Sphingomonas sp. WKB10]